jgi:acetylornithine/succinyldiaminopimelate/putrescine aminotransferase
MMLYRVHLAWEGFELTTLVVIGTDFIDSYKSNYHMIKATTARVLRFPPPINVRHQDITEILLKVTIDRNPNTKP